MEAFTGRLRLVRVQPSACDWSQARTPGFRSRPTLLPTRSSRRRRGPSTRAQTAAGCAPIFRAIRSGRCRSPSSWSATRPGQRAQDSARRRRGAAASTTIADLGRVADVLAAPAAVRQERRVERERDRPGQPRQHAAAQHHVADQADRDRGEVGAAGGDAVRRPRAGRRSSTRAGEREPGGAGLEVALGDRLAAGQLVGRRGCGRPGRCASPGPPGRRARSRRPGATSRPAAAADRRGDRQARSR